MKKQLSMIAVLISITAITFAQRPVFTNHRSYYGNRAYYPNQAFTAVRPGGFNYNPPYINTGNYQYYNYSTVGYYQQYGRQYQRQYQYNYGYQYPGYVNNCFPYLSNDLRYQKRQLIISGAAQIIRGIALPNYNNYYNPYSYGNYDNGYYGNNYYQNYGNYYNNRYYGNSYYGGYYYGQY